MWRGAGSTASAYCERLGPGLLAEPLNAVSNVAFLVAAALAWRAWRREGARDRAALVLIGVVTLIGLGSFAFHTAPSPLTLLADVLPIQLFVLGAFGLALRRHLEASPIAVGCGVAALFFAAPARVAWLKAVPALPSGGETLLLGGILLAGAALLSVAARTDDATKVPRALLALPGAALVAWPVIVSLPGAAAGYGAALTAILGVAAAVAWRARTESAPATARQRWRVAKQLAWAGAVFAASLALRQLDRPICAVWPFGTHFLWHVLNAVVLHRLIRALAARGDLGEAAAPLPR